MSYHRTNAAVSGAAVAVVLTVAVSWIYRTTNRRQVSPNKEEDDKERISNDTKEDQNWLHREGFVNGIRMHWVEAGKREDPLVILLHGFPEFWHSWRHQILALQSSGFRVVAPDMRGYNLTEKPRSGYDINTLTEDCRGLISLLTTTDDDKVFLVGHDWGGVIAYAAAARFPDKIHKVVVINAPHVAKTFGGSLSWTQRWNFWYIAFFQLPFLPELVLGYNRASFLCDTIPQISVVKFYDHSTIELYRDAASQPGSIHCMVNYYRNLTTSFLQALQHDKIRIPTLIVWGTRDPVLGTELYQNMSDWIDAPIDTVELDCGHLSPQEMPDEVSRQLIRFFGS